MERKTYPSGIWSERDGSLLIWGKGEKIQKNRFSAGDKIEDVPTGYHAAIRKAGHTPDVFCSAGSVIATRVLIPEIEGCIAHAKAEDHAHKMADKALLDQDITSGKAFRTAEIAAQYPASLQWARKSEPGDGYAEWVIFGYAANPEIKVHNEAIRQIVGDRKSIGSFPGCENTAWAITEEEWNQIIVRSKDIAYRKHMTQACNDASEEYDIQHKIDTGYCFYCETWCHGDCGHYSNDPQIKFHRDLDQAIREQNYGINEGQS